MEWINVKDQLPTDEKPVLTCYRIGSQGPVTFVGVLTYYAFSSLPRWQHEGLGLVVTHWMPLPEPPKEETE